MSGGEEIARIRRRLKFGPKLTRKGRAEYLRRLINQSRKRNRGEDDQRR
jgi:hypothetical protein